LKIRRQVLHLASLDHRTNYQRPDQFGRQIEGRFMRQVYGFARFL
jgi:hypothetical protein